MRIDIAVFDGLDEMDALGPLEVLRSAERAGADLRAQLVTRTPQQHVTGAYGLRFLPDATFGPGADIVVVPGGGWAARADVGAWGEAQRGDWLPLLAEAAGNSVMAGVCSGTMLLARAGIVGGRRANTHHTAWSDLHESGAVLVTDRVVDDGDLVTAGGVSSGIDLALWLVERFAGGEVAGGEIVGRDTADRVAERMEYERARPAIDQHF